MAYQGSIESPILQKWMVMVDLPTHFHPLPITSLPFVQNLTQLPNQPRGFIFWDPALPLQRVIIKTQYFSLSTGSEGFRFILLTRQTNSDPLCNLSVS